MNHKTTNIYTSDTVLIKELFDCELQDVEVLSRMTADCTTTEFVYFIIHIASDIGIAVFAAWLYDKIKNRDTDKTTINSQKITQNNTAQIMFMINNNVQNEND